MLANITWPSLVYYQREHAWWLIIAAIIVEFLILRRSLKTRPVWAFGIVVTINMFSASVGALPIFSSAFGRLPLLPWAGLYWTLHVDHGYYTYYAFCISTPCAALVSTVLEGLLLFTAFYKVTSKQCLYWLPIANLASAELTFCTLCYPPITVPTVITLFFAYAICVLAFTWRRRASRRQTGDAPLPAPTHDIDVDRPEAASASHCANVGKRGLQGGGQKLPSGFGGE